MISRATLAFVLMAGIALGVTRSGWAQAPASPHIGFYLSHDQAVHPLFGLPANLIVGNAMYRNAAIAAFSSTAGLVRVGDSVLLQTIGADFALTTIGTLALNGETAPVFGVGATPARTTTALDGCAVVWLPSINKLAVWTDGEFRLTQADPLPGAVVSLSPGKDSVTMLVAVSGGGLHRVAVSLSNGQVTANTALATQALSGYDQGGWTLLARPDGLTIQGSNGSSQTLSAITGAVTFASVSDEWVQVQAVTGTRSWLVHLDGAALVTQTLAASEIPTPRPRVRRVPL